MEVLASGMRPKHIQWPLTSRQLVLPVETGTATGNNPVVISLFKGMFHLGLPQRRPIPEWDLPAVFTVHSTTEIYQASQASLL